MIYAPIQEPLVRNTALVHISSISPTSIHNYIFYKIQNERRRVDESFPFLVDKTCGSLMGFIAQSSPQRGSVQKCVIKWVGLWEAASGSEVRMQSRSASPQPSCLLFMRMPAPLTGPGENYTAALDKSTASLPVSEQKWLLSILRSSTAPVPTLWLIRLSSRTRESGEDLVGEWEEELEWEISSIFDNRPLWQEPNSGSLWLWGRRFWMVERKGMKTKNVHWAMANSYAWTHNKLPNNSVDIAIFNYGISKSPGECRYWEFSNNITQSFRVNCWSSNKAVNCVDLTLLISEGLSLLSVLWSVAWDQNDCPGL